MHVVLVLGRESGGEHKQNLLMTTEDGLSWTLDTAVVSSRQQSYNWLCYHYQVEDAEGKVVRREWTQLKRSYWFDSSRSYIFTDRWQEMPLNSHLYTNAYQVTQHQPVNQQLQALQTPLYRKTILFRVSAPQLLAGQSVALIGDHPSLGAWNTVRYLRMEPIGQSEWILAVNVDMVPSPIEYKYVVVDDNTHELLAWEEGDNRLIQQSIADGQVLVAYGQPLRLCEKAWRVAGVVVPVFSLRSEHSYGVGDFGDLRRLVDWADETGMKVIQLLPVNDTTTDGQWHDSCPYNITSCFALHPHYLDLEQLGELSNKQHAVAFRRRQRELNALPTSDYEAVHRVKLEYAHERFLESGRKQLGSSACKAWVEANSWWLDDYVAWRCKDHQIEPDFLVYVQYHLHSQLKATADYARSKGIVLKGDVPIGVNRRSVETEYHPELFHLDSTLGTPPDAASPMGQNWGLPSYCWNTISGQSSKSLNTRLTDWWRRRFQWMSQYFDAIRIDHMLGFFRVWEIPSDAVYGVLGHFSPALPFTSGEISYFGLTFRRDLLTRPFINDRVLDRLFGIHANYVREHFLVSKPYGLYDVKPEYDTQQKIRQTFEGRNDENSLWIREGMMRLLANVLFLEDPIQPDMYHPRILAWQDSVFDALNAEEKDAYMRLYNNYFYQRHHFYWGQVALQRITEVLGDSRMLICAEDLGLLPDCVEPVLDQLRILTLEIQTMPKQHGFEFAHLEGNPLRSVAMFSTHDMSPMQLWWEENPERTQRYWVTMLQKEGRAPEQLPAHIAEEIIARHLYSPSMACMFLLQDWLAMDSQLRSKHPRQERINVPSDSYNRWQWRMHLTIEQLVAASRFNGKLKTMITRSQR